MAGANWRRRKGRNKRMNPRIKKILLLLLAAVLLVGSSRVQLSLDKDRDELGLTHAATLKDAPPLLAFTTVALGGFRGLISNFLWIRANDLQQDDKYFEAAQLANWITDLEPRFPEVWVFLAWNMTYNISIKFPDFADRWRWLMNGVSLLRDRALQYNPDNVIIYRELAWFFQNKMGYNLDDANVYFKRRWAQDMTPFFGPGGTNFTALVHPQTPAEETNVMTLESVYKMKPEMIAEVEKAWGPLDWRLPEAHAIYWACCGLAEAKKHPDKVKQDNLVQLRRVIYQSLYQAFKHGRYIANPYTTTGYILGPNLDLIQKTSDAILQLDKEENDPTMKSGYKQVYRSFLKDAVYFLYVDGRDAEAQKWYNILRDEYPNLPILDQVGDSYPTKMTMEEYAEARVQEEVGDTSQERTTAVISGLLARSYFDWILGRDTRHEVFQRLALKIYNHYQARTDKVKSNVARVGLPKFQELNQSVLDQLLGPGSRLPYAARAVLRTKLQMPPEPVPSAGGTNAAPMVEGGTNVLESSDTNAMAQ